jgi:hypothetical protein
MCGLGLRWAPPSWALLQPWVLEAQAPVKEPTVFTKIINKRISILIQGYLNHLRLEKKKLRVYIHPNFIGTYIFENRDYILIRFFEFFKNEL